MRIINLPLPCYAPEGEGGGGASGPSSTPSSPSGSAGTPSSSPSGAASSPGSGASATTHTPAPDSAAPAASSSPSDAEDEFAGLGSASDVFDDDFQPPAEVAPPAVTPPAEAAPAEPLAPAAAATPGEVTPQPASQPTGQPATTSPPFSLDEPGKIAQALAQGEEELVAHLAANEFKLSEKDLEALGEDAPAHIPNLLARVYLKSQVNLMRQMDQVVPRLIQKQVQTMRRSMEAENAFYSAWPQLDRTKHAPLVQQYATLFRQANPQATREQMIQALGPIVMHAAKIDPNARPANGAAGAPHLRTPPQPFRPATPGAAAMPQPQEENPFAGMAPGALPDEE